MARCSIDDAAQNLRVHLMVKHVEFDAAAIEEGKEYEVRGEAQRPSTEQEEPKEKKAAPPPQPSSTVEGGSGNIVLEIDSDDDLVITSAPEPVKKPTHPRSFTDSTAAHEPPTKLARKE